MPFRPGVVSCSWPLDPFLNPLAAVRLGDDLKVIERDLARSALGDEGVKRLMTIPGVDMVVALAFVAAIAELWSLGHNC